MNSHHKNLTGLCSLLLCLTAGPAAAAGVIPVEPPAGVDTSSWECGYCVFEQGWSGEIEIGAGHVSDPSAKFGEYNGLDDDGAFAIGNATARYRGDDARYLELGIRDLGLDNRHVNIEGGHQGRYTLFLDYDEISHAISDSARTPYLGSGTDTLMLPPGWVAAGSTAGMTALPGSLQAVDLSTQRKRVAAGLTFIPASRWETSVKVRHETRDGMKRSGGAFFFNTAQLVEPIDYVTDEVEVAVTHNTTNWQSKLAYYGSFFNNHDTSLTWQNAYNPIVVGADSGQRALPPDNRFHQLLFATGYKVSERTRVTGDIALGRMEQDEPLLAATVNPNIAVALPRAKAQAQVDTVTANLKVKSTLNNRVRLNAAYRYNDRDNRTPSDVFDWVTTDAFAATSRSNLPYSFTDHTVSAGGDYQLDNRTRLSGGYEYEQKQRSNQEVKETEEHTGWGKVTSRYFDGVDLAVRYAHAERDASGYNPVAETNPAQNMLLRKYNMADRVRDTGSISAGFSPHERITLGLDADVALDDYTDSQLGLKNSQELGVNADASLAWTDRTSLHAFAGWQRIESEQAGSQAFLMADWTAHNEDTINSFGLGVQHALIENRLDVGADYTLLHSTGKISVDAGAPGGVFPDLEADLDTLKLYADYKVKENLTLHAAYWYETYDSSSWMLDGVDPATVTNVLGFGESSPDYDVHAVMLSLRYRL